MNKKPKDLSANEREERDHGEGRDVYDTLLQSDTEKKVQDLWWLTSGKNQRT